MTTLNSGLTVECGGAYKDVVMGRGGDKDSFAHVTGALEYGVLNQRIDVAIHKAVLTEAGNNFEALTVELVGNDVCKKAGCIDNHLGADKPSVFGADDESAIFLDNAAYVEVPQEVRAVGNGTLCSGDGELVRLTMPAVGA